MFYFTVQHITIYENCTFDRNVIEHPNQLEFMSLMNSDSYDSIL